MTSEQRRCVGLERGYWHEIGGEEQIVNGLDPILPAAGSWRRRCSRTPGRGRSDGTAHDSAELGLSALRTQWSWPIS